MKIIAKGREQKGWATEATCTGGGNGGGGCGAKLLVEQVDLYKTSRTCRDETDYFDTFTCPSCGVETDLNTVPSQISTKLPAKKEWLEIQSAQNEPVTQFVLRIHNPGPTRLMGPFPDAESAHKSALAGSFIADVIKLEAP